MLDPDGVSKSWVISSKNKDEEIEKKHEKELNESTKTDYGLDTDTGIISLTDDSIYTHKMCKPILDLDEVKTMDDVKLILKAIFDISFKPLPDNRMYTSLSKPEISKFVKYEDL